MNRYQKMVKLQPGIDRDDIATKLWESTRLIIKLIIKRLHTEKHVPFRTYSGW